MKFWAKLQKKTTSLQVDWSYKYEDY